MTLIGGPIKMDLFGNEEVVQVVDHGVYDAARDQRYIGIVGMDGESWCTLTVCIPGVVLEPDEVLVKCWSENRHFREPLLESGIFKDTGKRRQPDPASFTLAEIWKVVV